MKTRNSVGCFCILAILAAAPAASADLLGSTVSLETFFPNLASSGGTWGPALVVDPDLEFPSLFSGVWTSDVSATTVRLDQLSGGNLLGPAEFNGFVYTFTDLATPIDTVTLDLSSTLVPFDYYATADQIFINYQDAGIVAVSFTLLNVTFVPTPGTASVCLLAGLALQRRRRN